MEEKKKARRCVKQRHKRSEPVKSRERAETTRSASDEITKNQDNQPTRGCVMIRECECERERDAVCVREGGLELGLALDPLVRLRVQYSMCSA